VVEQSRRRLWSHRKGIDVLVKSFTRYREGVIFEGFGRAWYVGQRMTELSYFIMPSLDNNLSTMVWVGARDDLIHKGINGWVFNEMTTEALAADVRQMSSWSLVVMQNAQLWCIWLACDYGAANYAAEHHTLVKLLLPLTNPWVWGVT
jgi:hypothetical protein